MEGNVYEEAVRCVTGRIMEAYFEAARQAWQMGWNLDVETFRMIREMAVREVDTPLQKSAGKAPSFIGGMGYMPTPQKGWLPYRNIPGRQPAASGGGNDSPYKKEVKEAPISYQPAANIQRQDAAVPPGGFLRGGSQVPEAGPMEEQKRGPAADRAGNTNEGSFTGGDIRREVKEKEKSHTAEDMSESSPMSDFEILKSIQDAWN